MCEGKIRWRERKGKESLEHGKQKEMRGSDAYWWGTKPAEPSRLKRNLGFLDCALEASTA